MRNIILVAILILSVSMPLVAAEGSEGDDTGNVQVSESSVAVPCHASEDSLGCTYRVMLEQKILEHPVPISELRRGLGMPMRLYL